MYFTGEDVNDVSTQYKKEGKEAMKDLEREIKRVVKGERSASDLLWEYCDENVLGSGRADGWSLDLDRQAGHKRGGDTMRLGNHSFSCWRIT